MTNRLGTASSPCHLVILSSCRPSAWPLKTLLTILLLGPLLAPLFQATGLPLVADSGALAHGLLSTYVCPTPAKSYALLGFPMAVCARCWGATIGLWLAWLLRRPPTTPSTPLRAGDHRPPTAEDGGSLHGTLLSSIFYPLSSILYPPPLPLSLARRLLSRYLALPWALRLGLALAAFLLWPLEIHGWADAPRWALLLNGASAGLWGGLFLATALTQLRRK